MVWRGGFIGVHSFTLEAMSWKEYEASRISFWVLATGSIEQHGPHLPLGADFFLANKIASEVTRMFPAVKLPSIPVGVNFAFRNWPGTIGISEDTYFRLLLEIASQAARKCPRLLIVNAHDENQPSLYRVARELSVKHGMEVVFFEWAEFVLDVLRSVCESRNEMHAGEGLTSVFLYWFPEQVRLNEIAVGALSPGGLIADDIHLDHRAVFPRQLDPHPEHASGVFGNPTLASAEKGEKIIGALLQRIQKLILELQWDRTGGKHS
jgi:creatinine amidohydrolase/Fe(II)-dependent formamide hydrolase-like protein